MLSLPRREVHERSAWNFIDGVGCGQMAFLGYAGQHVRLQPHGLVGADVRAAPVAAVFLDGYQEERAGAHQCGGGLGFFGGEVLLAGGLTSGQCEEANTRRH